VARGVGDVTYTQALNSRGGIECDFTVTRVGADEFMIVTGTALATHDLAWLRRQARAHGAAVTIDDITGQLACFALWGPRSRDILRTLSPNDLDDFEFMTARDIVVADVPVRALRVTFVGELGWELYAPTEYGAALWSALWAAGESHEIVAGGYRAIESMRLEKSYRVWGTDITAETNPYEAGLGFCVKLDKPGGFCGREALVAAKAEGATRRLRAIVLDDPRSVVLGSEPVRVEGAVVGRVTSGGFGYTTGASIAFAYLPIAYGPGVRVEIDLFGQWAGGVVGKDPLFDPTSSRVRS